MAAALAGCSIDSPADLQNPVARSLGWFSFARGEDIEASCTAGSPTKIRAVYNADYRQQVRVYQVGVTAPLQFDAWIGGGENIFSIDITHPLKLWAGASSSAALSDTQIDSLSQAIVASGLLDPPPGAPGFASDRSYWVVSMCQGGSFHRNGWLFPSDRFAKIQFDKLLFAADATKVSVEPPAAASLPKPPFVQGHAVPPWYLRIN